MKANSFRFDVPLAVLTLAASVLGAFIILDAGYARSIQIWGVAVPREFRTQLVMLLAGILVAAVCVRIPVEKWAVLARPAMVVSTLLVFAVAIPVLNVTMNGATRWIKLGPFNLQPSEFAKVAVVLYLAAVFATHKQWVPPKRVRNWAEWLDKVFVPKLVRAWPLLVVLLVALKVEREPDLGTAAVILCGMFAMFVLGGVSRTSLALLVGAAVLGGYAMVKMEPYRWDRIDNHLHRWDGNHVDDVGYQTTQSETAMASGEWVGVGLGSGRAKHMLPAATTDFVTATVGEEFGLLGSLSVLGLIGAIIARLFYLARRASTRFGALYLAGTASWIATQSCVNIMMANGFLPPIGIPLPFFSSGGSSLVALWAAVGVGLSLASTQPVEEAAFETRGDRRRNGRTRLSRA